MSEGCVRVPLVLSLHEAVGVVHHAHNGVHVFLGEHIDCLRRSSHLLQFLLCSSLVDWVEQASHTRTVGAMLQSGVAGPLIQSIAKEHRSASRVRLLRQSAHGRLRLSPPLREPLRCRLSHFLIYQFHFPVLNSCIERAIFQILLSMLLTFSSFSAQARPTVSRFRQSIFVLFEFLFMRMAVVLSESALSNEPIFLKLLYFFNL